MWMHKMGGLKFSEVSEILNVHFNKEKSLETKVTTQPNETVQHPKEVAVDDLQTSDAYQPHEIENSIAHSEKEQTIRTLVEDIQITFENRQSSDELPLDLLKVEPINCLWLNNGDKVDQDIQTNDSTKHLEETAEENQVQTEQLINYNRDASEKRSDITKNNDEQKEPNIRKAKHPILPPCNCKRLCIEKIDSEQQNNIHSQYWNLDKELENEYLFQRVESISKKKEKSMC